jgi:hypothetical protein
VLVRIQALRRHARTIEGAVIRALMVADASRRLIALCSDVR